MAQIIIFFSKQAIMASSVDATLYSEVFEVTDGVQLAAQFRVHMTTDDTVIATGVLEHCMDQRLTPTSVWNQVGSSMAVAANPPPSVAYQVVSNFGRFLRAKVSAPAGGASFIVSLDGVLRSNI